MSQRVEKFCTITCIVIICILFAIIIEFELPLQLATKDPFVGGLILPLLGFLGAIIYYLIRNCCRATRDMMLKEPNGPNGSWPTLPSYRRAMKTTTVLPITTEQPIPLEVQPPAYMDTFITGNAPPLYFESSINPSDGLPSRNTNNAEVI